MVFKIRPQLLVGDGASFIFLYMWAFSRLRPRAWSDDHSLLPPSLSVSRPEESRESILLNDIFALSVTPCMS